MKIIIIIKITVLFLWVNVSWAQNKTPNITAYQAQKFIEEQLDGGWGESFKIKRRVGVTDKEIIAQEEEVIRQAGLVLREILIMKKKQGGRLCCAENDCYTLAIDGELTPQTLLTLLSAIHTTLREVGVIDFSIELAPSDYDPGVFCKTDQQIFAETTTFEKYLSDRFPTQ